MRVRGVRKILCFLPFSFLFGFFSKKDFALVFPLEGEGEYEQSSIGGILSYLSFGWVGMQCLCDLNLISLSFFLGGKKSQPDA